MNTGGVNKYEDILQMGMCSECYSLDTFLFISGLPSVTPRNDPPFFLRIIKQCGSEKF